MKLRENILLILLVTVILFIVTICVKESFTGTAPTQANIKKNVPEVNPKVVASAKAELLNMIDTRPDLVESAQQVLAEPKIRATLNMLMFDE